MFILFEYMISAPEIYLFAEDVYVVLFTTERHTKFYVTNPNKTILPVEVLCHILPTVICIFSLGTVGCPRRNTPCSGAG